MTPLPYLQAAMGLVFLVFGAVAVWAAISTGQTGTGRVEIGLSAFFFVSVGLLFVRVSRARLVADDAGVEVINYLSTRRFRWAEIDRFEVRSAYIGISLILRSGETVKVNAIQKSNLYTWLHKRGRADKVLEELNALLAEHRSTSVPPLPPPRPSDGPGA